MGKVFAYVAVFVCGFLACALILQWVGGNQGAGIRNARATAASQQSIGEALEKRPARRTGRPGGPPIADAVARVEPAVVNIDIEGRAPADGLLGLLRPGRTGQEDLFEGSGSGIILSSDGYVVTNNHVVEPVAEGGAKGKITIRLDNGREYKNVKVIGRDPQTDLAVLHIEGAKNLPTAELGDSESLRVGDWAIAVGNPLGFNSTVTLGIVSALNRRNFGADRDSLDRVIQTDAAINPGNSGGALADIDGRVVGINTAIASSTGGSVGIGFAIPINAAKRIVSELVKQGKVLRPYLGVMYLPVNDVERKALPKGITLPKDNKGALILNERGGSPAVALNSPAAKAGLKEFDVIREIDGKPVNDSRIVKETVQAHKVGETLKLKVWRSGTIRDITVTLEAMPQEYGRSRRRNGVPERLPFLAPQP
jgi:serine protease Do